LRHLPHAVVIVSVHAAVAAEVFFKTDSKAIFQAVYPRLYQMDRSHLIQMSMRIDAA